MTEATPELCTFIKKRVRKNVRQKKESSSSEDDIIIKPKIKKQLNLVLHQKTSKFSTDRKHLTDDNDDDDHNFVTAVAYKASRSIDSKISKDQIATATCEIDTDIKCDTQAIFERAQKLNKEVTLVDKKVYKGINHYNQYIERKDTVFGNASSGFNRKGPMRAPGNVRSTVRWDYLPDVCKDYKETGFCTFGDSCKFLHDRSDYKHGWQIEQELAEGVYGIDGQDNRYEILHNSSDEEHEDVPYCCLICRKDFKDPVVTIECALKRYKKTARCYACTADTKGFFKFAKGLIERIKASRAKCHKDSDLSDNEQSCVESNIDNQSNKGDNQVKLPASSEPKWAKPELVEYCDSDEESD